MSTSTVYGASDDLIEIDGALTEEFQASQDAEDGDLLAFSNGTVLRIRYAPSGVWRIALVAGQAQIDSAPENDDRNYSDRATVDGATWVVHAPNGTFVS